MECKIAKLVTGELVVGYLVGFNNEYYLEDPYLVMTSPQKDGTLGIMLLPYMYPFGDNYPPLDSKHIIMVMDCPKEFENEYIKEKSGIEVPNKSIIM